jgi:hypothetical protein
MLILGLIIGFVAGVVYKDNLEKRRELIRMKYGRDRAFMPPHVGVPDAGDGLFWELYT